MLRMHKYALLRWSVFHSLSIREIQLAMKSLSILFALVVATTGVLSQSASSASAPVASSAASQAAVTASAQVVSSSAASQSASGTIASAAASAAVAQATTDVRMLYCEQSNTTNLLLTGRLRHPFPVALLPRLQLLGHRPLLHYELRRNENRHHERHLHLRG